jgi:multidrug efflux pump subunit AcrA (membrane-fusion protein)
MVYVIDSQSIERRFVRLGEQINNQQHIIAGLKVGDKLAVDYMPSAID